MSKKTISTVMGAAIVSSLAGVANAGENPFAMKDLATGYMQVAEAEAAKQTSEMKCGEGKCGGAAVKAPEMNCGAMKDAAAKKEETQKKAMEGKCAGMNMGGAPAAPAAPAAPKAP